MRVPEEDPIQKCNGVASAGLKNEERGLVDVYK